MTPTAQALRQWLQDYGPLWVNGYRHITVIACIRQIAGGTDVLVYDPALPHNTLGEWRPFGLWFSTDRHSRGDASEAARVSFLHLPRILNQLPQMCRAQ